MKKNRCITKEIVISDSNENDETDGESSIEESTGADVQQIDALISAVIIELTVFVS